MFDVANFDMKEMLLLSLNDGRRFWDTSKQCGCIKGVFAVACGQDSDTITVDHDGRSWLRQIALRFPRLHRALDVAERILLVGFPQKAKLYLSFVIEKYPEILRPESEDYKGHPRLQKTFLDRDFIYLYVTDMNKVCTIRQPVCV